VDQDATHLFMRDRILAIDVVHADWLSDYLDDHLLPFAERYGALAEAHHEEIASGEGFVAGMGSEGRREIESRLRPRTLSDKRRRAGKILRNLNNDD
jgi:hypothetical protein